MVCFYSEYNCVLTVHFYFSVVKYFWQFQYKKTVFG